MSTFEDIPLNHLSTHSATTSDDTDDGIKDGKAICEICDLSFHGQVGLQCHLQIVHEDVCGKFKCNHCVDTFSSFQELKSHFFSLHKTSGINSTMKPPIILNGTDNLWSPGMSSEDSVQIVSSGSEKKRGRKQSKPNKGLEDEERINQSLEQSICKKPSALFQCNSNSNDMFPKGHDPFAFSSDSGNEISGLHPFAKDDSLSQSSFSNQTVSKPSHANGIEPINKGTEKSVSMNYGESLAKTPKRTSKGKKSVHSSGPSSSKTKRKENGPSTSGLKPVRTFLSGPKQIQNSNEAPKRKMGPKSKTKRKSEGESDFTPPKKVKRKLGPKSRTMNQNENSLDSNGNVSINRSSNKKSKPKTKKNHDPASSTKDISGSKVNTGVQSSNAMNDQDKEDADYMPEVSFKKSVKKKGPLKRNAPTPFSDESAASKKVKNSSNESFVDPNDKLNVVVTPALQMFKLQDPKLSLKQIGIYEEHCKAYLCTVCPHLDTSYNNIKNHLLEVHKKEKKIALHMQIIRDYNTFYTNSNGIPCHCGNLNCYSDMPDDCHDENFNCIEVCNKT